MATHIAFLRAINVGGNNKIAMGDLRRLFEELGFEDVRSLLQSGNVVFAGGEAGAGLEKRLELETKKSFDVTVDYVVRSAAQMEKVIAGNPFPDAARNDPGHLVVMFLKKPVASSAIESLRAAIKGREAVEGGGSEVYITYPDGIGTSQLTIQVIEKHLGCRGTARNWNTTLKVAKALAGGRKTMTVEEARAILLSQPDASEGAHHGHPDFRVGKTLFATLWPDKGTAVLKLPLPFAESLEQEFPELYRVVSRPKGFGWVSVVLEAADRKEFESLVEMAHSQLTSKAKERKK